MKANRERQRESRKEDRGRRRNNHNARRAERRREKLSYLHCNGGKGSFTDWSCHGNGWHLLYVCASQCVSVHDCICVGCVDVNVLLSIWKCLSVSVFVCVEAGV